MAKINKRTIRWLHHVEHERQAKKQHAKRNREESDPITRSFHIFTMSQEDFELLGRNVIEYNWQGVGIVAKIGI